MASGQTTAPRVRLLLVGADAAWEAATIAAARVLDALLDVLPGVQEALAWMLHPAFPSDRLCTHVLAMAPLDAAWTDALAGMVDEVTAKPTPLLLLGETLQLGRSVLSIPTPEAGSIVRAVEAGVPGAPDALSGAALREALHAGWLRMRFQPILAADTLLPVGLEALARLHHPARGILHPRDFLPQAIEHGQDRSFAGITAARTMLELRGFAPRPGLRFTLNVPLKVFVLPYALDRARHLADLSGVSPQQVVIELVETATLPDMAVLKPAVARWRAAGFGVAIDDAGPALPHWRRLLELDFSMLKLDGRLGADPVHARLASEIANAARAHGLPVVAEGIEDAAGLARMRGIGVDMVQGFLFSRPLPAMAVPIWLEQWQTEALFQASGARDQSSGVHPSDFDVRVHAAPMGRSANGSHRIISADRPLTPET